MLEIINRNFDYSKPIEIGQGVFWIGVYDKSSKLHCNPYIIIDKNEAIVIDAGSRLDFPEVFMKIMQTGIYPYQIKGLVYQHYDPDICGGISSFEDIISSSTLKIIADEDSIDAIQHYGSSANMLSLNTTNYEYKFSSGRTLLFFKTPYCHTPGSIITYDTKTKILFTSDLFGSFNDNKPEDYVWSLLLYIKNKCKNCKNITDFKKCYSNEEFCDIADILDFTIQIMTSNKALQYSIDLIKQIPAEIIAPQHGCIIYKREDIDYLLEIFSKLNNVGIDNEIYNDFPCISERLKFYEK